MKALMFTIFTLFSSYKSDQNIQLNEAISDVGDFIEWSNEDLFQGRITEEEHAIQVENYNQLILTLKSIQNDYENNPKY